MRGNGFTVARYRHAMKNESATFGAYLARQASRDDSVGVVARNFVRFVKDGPHRLADFETAATVRIWLNQLGATKFEHDALGRAERAWLDSMWA